MRRGRLAAALAAGLAIVTATPALAADGFGPRVLGQHVYDLSGTLSAVQRGDLEAEAALLDRAGTATVVYLRAKLADDATTLQDARDLLNAWQVETVAGARDGLVVLLNLQPGSLRRGWAALAAGAGLLAAGRLASDRLLAIRDGVMKARLAAGDLVGAISAALRMAADDLRASVKPAQARAAPPSDGLPDAWLPVLIALLAPAAITVVLFACLRVGRRF